MRHIKTQIKRTPWHQFHGGLLQRRLTLFWFCFAKKVLLRFPGTEVYRKCRKVLRIYAVATMLILAERLYFLKAPTLGKSLFFFFFLNSLDFLVEFQAVMGDGNISLWAFKIGSLIGDKAFLSFTVLKTHKYFTFLSPALFIFQQTNQKKTFTSPTPSKCQSGFRTCKHQPAEK